MPGYVPAARRAALFFIVAVCSVIHAQIKTGKSQFWTNLENGIPRTFTPMGTSVSQTKNSYWPGELSNQLRERFGDLYSINGAYTSRQGHTSQMGIDQTLSTVIDKEPDAVTIEYSIMDSHPERGISLRAAEDNLEHIIDELRTRVPGVEIFLWKAAYPRDPQYQQRPNLDAYYDLMETVAINKQTYFINTYDTFKAIYDSLAALGKEDDYITWIHDTHHPSLYAASHLIVPAMIGAMSGEPVAGLGAALSVSSLAGRVFYVGDELSVEWVHDPELINGVHVALSVDAGQLFTTLTSTARSSSPFVWPVPETLNGKSIITDSAVVRVLDTEGFYTGNSGIFAIQPAGEAPTLAALPLDKATYTVGETMPVAWRYDPNKVTSFDVEISFDGGRTFHLINKDAPVEADHYDWVVPETIDGVTTAALSAIIKISDYNDQYESTTAPFAIRVSSPQELFIDNADATVSAVGQWPSSDGQSGYYGESYQHDNNESKGEKQFTFSAPVAEAGYYEVFMRWTAHLNRASNVAVIIEHMDGSSPVIVNQRVNGSRWNLLGAFNFDDEAVVTLRNAGTNGFVIADAVRLLQVGPVSEHATSQRSPAAADARALRMSFRGRRIVLPPGARRLRVYDCAGAVIMSRQLGDIATETVALPSNAGLHIVEIQTVHGRYVARIPSW
jgi:hypothetical protein